MTLPTNITRDHVLSAISNIDSDKLPPRHFYKRYALEYEERRYPPRYVLSMANKNANGVMLKNTDIGSIETNVFLSRLGFTIIDLSKATFTEN